jgi:hypothetical protein
MPFSDLYHYSEIPGNSHHPLEFNDGYTPTYSLLIMLSALFEYFATVSQQAIQCEPPHRGRVEMTHFGRYTLVVSEVNGVIFRRWFLDQSPIYAYYIETTERRHLVAAVYKSGCKAGEVAELLGLTDSAVSADLKFMRTNYRIRLSRR